MLRSLMFSGNLTAHKIFAIEKEDEINAAVLCCAADFPDLRGGALKNKIISEIWDGEDHSYWEGRVLEIETDIFEFVEL